LLIMLERVLAETGWGRGRGGNYISPGLRFLFILIFDWMRRFAQGIRGKLRRDNREAPRLSKVSFVKQ